MMTNSCEQMRAQMTFYLDGELQRGERAELETHLQTCAACHQLCARQAELLAQVRAAQPLYEAPPALRARVTQLLNEPTKPTTASPQLRRRVRTTLSHRSAGLRQRPMRLMALAMVLLTFALGSWWLLTWRAEWTRLQPSELALMAVDSHLRYLRGQLPLEISSASPEEISSWFAGKVPFRLKLPNYQEASGQQKLYSLEGARLVNFKNDYVALVAYQMRQRPITLVITSDNVTKPAGGEQIKAKGLNFHYNSINGFKVMTWSDRGLTYALVSDLEERGQQSCLVCHAGTQDQDFIETLKLPKATR
jgi:anti-sigma factor RsiW